MAAAQQGAFPGQSMGPPSHASPMLPGPTSNGDPAMAQPPGGMGVRPPIGIMPPGTGSPAANPTMQPFVGGAPAALTSQQQQQKILSQMQQCMTNTQKLQQMLNTGKVVYVDTICSVPSSGTLLYQHLFIAFTCLLGRMRPKLVMHGHNQLS